jgi:hypothetical protein
MLPSQIGADYVKNEKCFRRLLELGRFFDFLNWQHCFYFFIASKLQYIYVTTIIPSATSDAKFRHFEFSRKKFTIFTQNKIATKKSAILNF